MGTNRMHTRILFATPGAIDGGGIGRMTGYIVDRLKQTHATSEAAVLDTRGGGSVLLSPFYLSAAIARMGRRIVRNEADVVHINVSERTSFVRKAAIQLFAGLLGAPTVVHLHGASFIDYFRTGPFARGISRWLFRHGTRTIVLGESWRRFLVDEVGIDSGKIEVLYNAVPDFVPRDFARTPPGPGRPPGQPVSLLVLANLCERKGIGTLLHACALLKQRGFAFEVTLGGGGEIDTYRRLAEELGIAGSCRFIGWASRDEAHALIQSHDMLLLPSTHEGLPMVILEALCAQLPVITTPVGSIPEVLEHGETALIVPVNDRTALADAVQELAGDPALYRRLARAGRVLFERQFHIDGYCQRLCAIYDDVHRIGRRGRIRLRPSKKEAALRPENAPAASEPSLPRMGRQ